MILKTSVELTKVHYYDKNKFSRNIEISTISNETLDLDKKYLENAIIKRNIFGHKWVLKINETENSANKKKSKVKVTVYVVVFICILIAVGFGIFVSLEPEFFNMESKTHFDHITTEVPNILQETTAQTNPSTSVLNTTSNRTKENLTSPINTEVTTSYENSTIARKRICSKCKKKEEICLNIFEDEEPQCVKIVDKDDPTGCGGLCKINTEYCKLLDKDNQLFKCINVTRTLNCSNGFFNCGNMCIAKHKRCDGIFHCSDNSDEINCACNTSSHFQCGNLTSCIEKWRKCDGKVDCWDGFDELECTKGLYFVTCTKEEVPCLNGQCILKEYFCDGTYQCIDKSDEPEGC